MMNEKMIEKLTTKGFTRWTKGKYDRLYINAKELGLVCEYYKTGNIHSAEFRGEGISNSKAYRMKSAKTYIDIATEEVVSQIDNLEEAAKEILEEVRAEIEAEEAAAKAEEIKDEADNNEYVVYAVQVGYKTVYYYQTRAEAMAKAEEEAEKPENDGQRIRIAIQHDLIDLWGDKEYIVIRNWNRTEEELAQEIAQIINEAEVKSNDDYEELCELAGMSEDWKKATGTQAKAVIAAAAEKLGVKITC